MARWIRDYATGVTICAVCGKAKGNRETCCPTSPYVSYDDFVEQYFGKDADVPRAIAREFWDDYLTGNHRSIAAYKKATSSLF